MEGFVGFEGEIGTFLYHLFGVAFGISHIVCDDLVSPCGFARYEQFIALTNGVGGFDKELYVTAGNAGGMLGGAFNNLAEMVLGANPTWQWVPFVIILLIGHALNLAMSALGAFVHPLRLSFVEYFKNSGYEGKGTLYKPFAK